ncbi:hypothetical protein [Sphingobacterium sp. HMA12]|uniref:hypothetical protein n=1 Tax=Sphingobacterium sp. HMA12 TaxID=2050894 RepID=UPI000CEA0836|nr:hypothetical protein [Sphingobacterium sp. HMA12]
MKFFIQILFLLIVHVSFAQRKQVINNEVTAFKIENKQDTIDFIVIDQDLTKKKPIFLWCQGSQPVPLYFNFKKNGLWMDAGGITNFDYQEIKKHYHLVVISMPKTPLIVEESELNNQYSYIGASPDDKTPSIAFQKADYLENYVNRALIVLKFLRKQKWADNSKLIVAGHSQGSKVASHIAIKDKHVSKLGLFGANPYGRIDELVRNYRKQAERKEISWEQANKQIEKQYQFYRDANNPNKVSTHPFLLAWKSFSKPLVGEWLSFNKPIYMAYGTNDVSSDLCDLVPLLFIGNKKQNLTYKRYLNLEHNFFDVDSTGAVNHSKPHWKEVMSAFVKWTIE